MTVVIDSMVRFGICRLRRDTISSRTPKTPGNQSSGSGDATTLLHDQLLLATEGERMLNYYYYLKEQKQLQ
jgi:hypothetical protein